MFYTHAYTIKNILINASKPCVVVSRGISGPTATGTHRHIHYVSSSLSTSQHGGYTGAGRVVCVHVDGHIGEAVSQRANQKLAGLWLQQAGHILVVRGEITGGGGERD